MILAEPDVALTDYTLTFECLAFCWVLAGIKTSLKIPKWSSIAAFLGLGLAAFTGGTVHGFFQEESSLGFRLLWPVTLLGIGLTAFSCWIFASDILFVGRLKKSMQVFAVVALGAYVVEILFLDQRFKIAIFFYLPAAILLFGAAWRIYFRERTLPAATGISGIAIALIAPVLQQRGISWSSLSLNHNSLYHLLQALSNAMVFWAARWFLQKEHAV
jgi:hypothetical protein